MSSTNKTTNYELSQFNQTDKPTWLGDYNGDMLKIDGRMKTNADDISTNAGAITTLSGRVDTAEGNITSMGTDIGNIQNDITGLQNKNTSQDSAINNIRTNLNAFEVKFNLSQITSYSDGIYDNRKTGISGTSTDLKIAQNSEGSIFKFYGETNVGNYNATSGSLSLTAIPGLSGRYGIPIGQLLTPPTEAYTIKGAMYYKTSSQQTNVKDVHLESFAIGTDGKVYIFYGSSATYTIPSYVTITFDFIPCIYFNTNFGDDESI